MIPAQGARHFLLALLLGLGLGCYYGFLRPLRPKHTHLSDFLFMVGLGWVWLVLNFAVCFGDIRLGCNMGLVCGAFLWELTVGRLLRPVFAGFWAFVGKCLRLIGFPFQVFFKKYKNFLFSSWQR